VIAVRDWFVGVWTRGSRAVRVLLERIVRLRRSTERPATRPSMAGAPGRLVVESPDADGPPPGFPAESIEEHLSRGVIARADVAALLSASDAESIRLEALWAAAGPSPPPRVRPVVIHRAGQPPSGTAPPRRSAASDRRWRSQ
jgi:hypothetical protein